MALKHPIHDTDAHFRINPITREIINESPLKRKLMQFDHQSERFSFDIPKMIEGHDMSKCNVVMIYYINIDNLTKKYHKDFFEVEDLTVSEEDENFLVFTWLIKNTATRLAGSLNFLVKFACVDETGMFYCWHSDFHTGIKISKGIDAAEEFTEEYSDILAEWAAVIESLKDGTNGVPAGGSTGQFLKKRSAEDFDVEWSSISSYNGEMEVTPSTETQTLDTSGKVMDSDITINAIPYSEVSNEYGGKTVTIGG